ncbi:hypothetical protein AURDEDRAFT_174578 [Auricularia subglabra TFB-10046 SS5]|uniref:Uncharacterized protein n=1 Tax=Auricularia subglabra (strain TFB-10046 / SS5) TaxID=717982 RepID=J0WSY0_AURST|nr:hypothetical protein AURDEDRAFT_174578 [Auricularia subglabra TFB-10046 SS5]
MAQRKRWDRSQPTTLSARCLHDSPHLGRSAPPRALAVDLLASQSVWPVIATSYSSFSRTTGRLTRSTPLCSAHPLLPACSPSYATRLHGADFGLEPNGGATTAVSNPDSRSSYCCGDTALPPLMFALSATPAARSWPPPAYFGFALPRTAALPRPSPPFLHARRRRGGFSAGRCGTVQGSRRPVVGPRLAPLPAALSPSYTPASGVVLAAGQQTVLALPLARTAPLALTRRPVIDSVMAPPGHLGSSLRMGSCSHLRRCRSALPVDPRPCLSAGC